MGTLRWNTLARGKWIVSRPVSFWFLASLLGFFLFSASAPSPLYGVYQALWHFSPITLTVIYAFYALAALAASLLTGRLSDHLGRRPVLMLALIIQIAGMAAFILARGVGALFVGRFLQGLSTGIAAQAISAWLLDLQPVNNPRIGGLIGGIMLLVGLAAGALGSGVLVQYAPDPLHLVFWLLVVIYTLSFGIILIIPDISPRKPGWFQSLQPKVGVPSVARPLFTALAPSLVAIWALGGLYLSLGPSLAIALLHSNSHIAGGLIIVALMGGGALAATLLRAVDPRALITRGAVVLIVGVGLTLFSVLVDSPIGLYLGSLVAGIGFGPGFSGIFRSLASLAPPDKRGALIAAIYVIIYVSFGIPAVVAGILVVRVGLRDTAYAYGLTVMILATITVVAVSRRKRLLAIS